MTNDELADEIEKRRGGSIEYLGKLLWSNSSRIIAALRRSQPSGMVDGTIINMRSCPNCKEGWISAAEDEGRNK